MSYRAILSLLFACALISCAPKQAASQSQATEASQLSERLHYYVNLNDRADDTFKVTLKVAGLPEDILQFASTAPGTYQVMDIGRFVRDLKAYDNAGNLLESSQISTNQFKVEQGKSVSKITYAIAETWDTPVKEFDIYPMAGTSIEDKYAQVLTHAVFGFPKGDQHLPVTIDIDMPESWIAGSALERNEAGHFLADNYDHAVDSPILVGELSYASRPMKGGMVDIYTWSDSGTISSEEIMEETWDIIESVTLFLKGFPVDRYTFLYVISDEGTGAWEHSYSSNYAILESQWPAFFKTRLDSVVAHEVFHILTPLQIHSEIIEQFNFEEPVPSKHLWLYEATTEWAAHAMQLRSNTIDLDAYLSEMRQKLTVSDMLPQETSLVDLALTSYTPAGSSQYVNIYMRGAFTIGLMDLKLLKLSEGKRGLREVLLELADKYGIDQAFDEDTFFDDFVAHSHPSMREFIDNYIIEAKPLPIKESFDWIGINYTAEKSLGGEKPDFGFTPVPLSAESVKITNIKPELAARGLIEGSTIQAVADIPLKKETMMQAFRFLQGLKIGDTYEMTILADGETKKVNLIVLSQEDTQKHIFEINEAANQSQTALRAAWMRNL